MTAFRLPAEYEAQSGVWLTWPGNPETWRHCREAAETAHARLVSTISKYQNVDLICQKSWQTAAKERLKKARANFERITFHDWPANDAWCRDHGPLFLVNEKGEKKIADIPYNAWGGKFPPWDDDDAIAKRVSELRKLPRTRLPIFGEGGAIEVNRQGVMITTESVWLNSNRNPGLTKTEAEAVFAEYFGVKETLWLREGLIGDDTDGHIDTISRFVDDNTVVTVMPEENDPNYEVLRENHDRIAERFKVVTLPHPRTLAVEGFREEVLPATYANFLILNEAVLVPTYGQAGRDEDALHILHDVFPARRIIGLDCTDFIWEGGAIHCLTMQETLGNDE